MHEVKVTEISTVVCLDLLTLRLIPRCKPCSKIIFSLFSPLSPLLPLLLPTITAHYCPLPPPLTISLQLHQPPPPIPLQLYQPRSTLPSPQRITPNNGPHQSLISQLKAFSTHALLTWNKLPSSIRSISSSSLFKTKLKTFLFSLQH